MKRVGSVWCIPQTSLLSYHKQPPYFQPKKQGFCKCSNLLGGKYELPLTFQNLYSGKCCTSWSNLICGGFLTGQVSHASSLNQVKNNSHPTLRHKPLCMILLSSVANLPQNFPTFLPMCCGEGDLSRADLPLPIPLLCDLHGACPSHPHLSSSPTDGHMNCTCLREVVWRSGDLNT